MQSVQALYARFERAAFLEPDAASAALSHRRIPGAFPGAAALHDGEAEVLFEKSHAQAPGALPPTPQATARHEAGLLCRQLLHRARQVASRSPIDRVLAVEAQQACDAAGRIFQAEQSKQQWQAVMLRVKQAAPALTVASLFGQLAAPGKVSLGVLAGVVWGTLRYNLSPLLGLYPKVAGDEIRAKETLLQKEQALWAHQRIGACLQLAQERLGPLPKVRLPPASSPSTSSLPCARAALEDLAARLDAARQRHYTVHASVQALKQEAKAAAVGAQAAVAATYLGLGSRALSFCGAALVVTFTVGFLHPFASVLGFFFSAACLTVAAALLLTNVRRAVHFLDGNMTQVEEEPAHTLAKQTALANLAQQALGKCEQAWHDQLADEASLVALEMQLRKALALEDAAFPPDAT